MNNIPKTSELFDFDRTIAKPLLSECEYPYEVLPRIADFIKTISGDLDSSFKEVTPGVFIAEDARIWEGATICPPTIIGHKTEVRPGAFIRGNVIVGDGAVIGNSTELKNSIVFDGAELPHYNYVGDSIIGYKSHMGAGAIASNLRLDRRELSVFKDGEKVNTGLKKIGVFLGDRAELGCGCVACPGSAVGRETLVFPLVRISGVIPEKMIWDGETYKERY